MLLVVSYRNSTSNHNIITLRSVSITLYLIEILHQTTTMFVAILLLSRLYLIEILHQTTTSRTTMLHRLKLYLIEILHQTTTIRRSFYSVDSCILSKFYIKPQQQTIKLQSNSVVSYRNSTSNHNSRHCQWARAQLYLIEILHQTTTPLSSPLPFCCCILSKFYIKPQQRFDVDIPNPRCILSKFYIKPQLWNASSWRSCVVSYRNSTSNHNMIDMFSIRPVVVSYRNSTSNHNHPEMGNEPRLVVSYRNSTSNHNRPTTSHFAVFVVSYRNSTSNHN